MPPEPTPFARCLEQLRGALLAAVRDDVLPAYVSFARFVKEEYAPRGRDEVGAWSLPDGAARYAFQARASTTTRLTPEEIHELGLREMARIEQEARAVADKAGFADLAAFRAAIASDPKLRPTSRTQILEIYRGHLDAMRQELPRLFGRLPRSDLVVAPMEEFREKEAAAYHEAVPGHHLQIAIQLELGVLPAQRRFWLHYGAFAEGWALYAERRGRRARAPFPGLDRLVPRGHGPKAGQGPGRRRGSLPWPGFPSALLRPPTLHERLQVARRDPDRVEHPDLRQRPLGAERVDRGRAGPEQSRHLPNRQEWQDHPGSFTVRDVRV